MMLCVGGSWYPGLVYMFPAVSFSPISETLYKMKPYVIQAKMGGLRWGEGVFQACVTSLHLAKYQWIVLI